MNKKVHRLPLESIIQTTQQGTTRFPNGYQYIVLSEVETFADYSIEWGKINLKSGKEITVKKAAFDEFVALITGSTK